MHTDGAARADLPEAGFRLRPAAAGDAEFLTAILLEAFNWDAPRFSRDEILATPHFAHYVTGWPRAGDFGVVAEAPSGAPVGAAWARTFPAHDPGYGHVDPQVPELTVGVLPGHRGRGVGGALLDAVVALAARSGVDRLSLSVEDGNHAAALYASRGFVTVGREGNADTMVIQLGTH
ncbi:GNAT family N-acetyltransferase [Streptomyces sp. R302]|uniref:GNAT family N-acetyltransferase n=1 Tax=unclassified Streptomyces TaxID=2593676 RepID=UPI00145ECCB2|nr:MULTISPECIES: GNAT family N-acetyltransferase [unclassified Streptomyces]NML51719.1 GNAT family N-acetyltransferase [Streptomyces sp. R301]NML81339.1 GNAT family N-acetyltransferase [Streptomyces sp. R302]